MDIIAADQTVVAVQYKWSFVWAMGVLFYSVLAIAMQHYCISSICTAFGRQLTDDISSGKPAEKAII